MLDLDCAVPQLARLALRTTDRLARLFCERLKHTQKVLSRLASRPSQVSRVKVTRAPTTASTETAEVRGVSVGAIGEAATAALQPITSIETAAYSRPSGVLSTWRPQCTERATILLTAFCAALDHGALAPRGLRSRARPMSSPTPPTPDGEPWAAGYVSSNGATSDLVNERARRLVVLGYITAVALPPIGLILGIVLATRPAKASSRHWMWIIVVSIIGAVLWVLVFVSGALTSTNNDLT